jgi:hypothetical protein
VKAFSAPHGSSYSPFESTPIPLTSFTAPPPSIPIKIVYFNNVYLFTLSRFETLETFLQKLRREFPLTEFNLFDEEGGDVKMKKEKHYQIMHEMAKACQEQETILKLFLI